jgi:hypothetical protein
MRFALAEVEPQLRTLAPGFRELVVRVRPSRGGPTKA